MKANEAPEKIYVHEASAPELTEKLPYHIEYTRTDAFIDKAVKWISNFYNNNTYSYLTDRDIEDFKKYMEG